MPSKRESILAAVATTLVGTTGVAMKRIYRSRVEAFARNEAPALVIEPGTDSASEELVSNCKIDWRLPVLIAVYTRGAIPDQLADPIIISLHSKLMADRTLGGLAMDIFPGTVDPQMEKADQPALWTVCTYNVRYRSSVADLTT
jgi:hypothetical protein